MTKTAAQTSAAPLDMAFQLIDPANAAPMPITLIQADGSVEDGPRVLLTLLDQPWRRLDRLYAQVLETTTSNRPERGRGLPFRPSPRYVFFPNPNHSISPKAGLAEAWADLGFSGKARFYDGDGLPIDPVGVMAAFAAILKQFPILQAVDLGKTALDPLPLAQHLPTLAPSTKTRVRLAGPDGKPYGGQHLTGLRRCRPTPVCST
jgi:hypothetical protein